jgi:Ca2+-binding EF-hand superfamily protein
MSSLFQFELNMARNVFQNLDKNRDGKLSSAEFAAFEDMMGQPMPANQVTKAMSIIFGSADNVDFQTFLAGNRKLQDKSSDVHAALEKLDKDGGFNSAAPPCQLLNVLLIPVVILLTACKNNANWF